MLNTKLVITILAVVSASFIGITAYQTSQKKQAALKAQQLQVQLDDITKKVESTKQLADSANAKAAEAAEILNRTDIELKETTKRLSEKETEIANLQKKFESTDKEKQAYQAGMEKMSELVNESKQTIAELTNDRDQLKLKVDDLIANRQAIVDDMAELKAENDKLHKELDQLIKDLAQMKQTVMQSAELPQLKAEKQSLKQNPKLSTPQPLLNPSSLALDKSGKPGCGFKPDVDIQTEAGNILLEATWVSKYICEGFDNLDDHAAFQPGITFDLGQGFNAGVWWSVPGSSGHVDDEELNYWISYSNSFFNGCRYQTDYELSWIYVHFPRVAVKDAGEIDMIGSFAWPNLVCENFIPSYDLIYYTPAKGGGDARGLAGFIHRFGFDYLFPVTIADCQQQMVNFSWDIYYNDGAGEGDGSVDHDWSHIVWGLETDIELGRGTLTPGLYYQTSMEDSVNEEDELWTGITYSMRF